MVEFAPHWIRAAFEPDANPSFADLVRRIDPALLPRHPDQPPVSTPKATTILALRFDRGVVMAGDRRATEGFTIADRRIEKVFPADRHSAVAIAGAAGPATDMVKLFSTELEHYEKVEGERLSLEGKANKLAQLIKLNFPMALQGIVILPLFAGWDVRRERGRIFRYDIVGGRYEELDYHATGSGGVHARASIKGAWRPSLDRDAAVRAALEALSDAAEEDAATGGPDLERDIYPSTAVVSTEGFEEVASDELRALTESLLAAARDRRG